MENFENTIAYEDDYLLVVDKPPGILVHPTTKEFGSTLCDEIEKYYKKHNISGGLHPVSRLDRFTSGLVIFAKEGIIQNWLTKHHFLKEYLAITDGMPPAMEGIIDAPIARAEGSIILRCISENGKPARTLYRVLKKGKHPLLCLQLETGRTHQIRVHLSHIGCPVLGDGLYGTPSPPSRHFLHAWHLKFSHPVGDFTVEITRCMPKDMEKMLNS